MLLKAEVGFCEIVTSYKFIEESLRISITNDRKGQKGPVMLIRLCLFAEECAVVD